MRFTTLAVYVTLAAQVASLAALVVFEETRGSRLAAQIAALQGAPHSQAAQSVAGQVSVFAVLVMLVAGTAVASAVAYLTWLVRARQANDRAATAGPVLAAWLVPFVNLVAPVLLLDEVWKGSRPPYDQRVRWLSLVAAWWLGWLGSLVLLAARLADDSEGTLTGIGARELAITGMAALLCAATVREVTRLQTARGRARLRYRSLSRAA
ncbi:DUF4328 domain-containing protein [Thermoactinospora rubra]|uniref:DUF4328 domain-containing protein n=1 Tax=Thermoactinospora rubra TaxID=1088767 RepID=UPI001F0A338D|nr:DUF4328 domain-containing protein [Thermoactinospora rubra]